MVPTDGVNTFTALTPIHDVIFTGGYVLNFVCYNPTTSSTYQVSTSGGVNGAIQMEAWGGENATLDQEATNLVISDRVNVGPIMPSSDNALLLTSFAFFTGASGAISIDSGFTIDDTLQPVSGSDLAFSQANLLQTSATSKQPTWLAGGGSVVGAYMACFTISAAPSGHIWVVAGNGGGLAGPTRGLAGYPSV